MVIRKEKKDVFLYMKTTNLHLLLFLALCIPNFLLAQCDEENPDWGIAGYISQNINGFSESPDLTEASAITADGIILAGHTETSGQDRAVLAYFNFDGTLKSDFGNGGIVTHGTNYFFWALTVQDDGKIVAGGYIDLFFNDNFLIMRYNADGTLDQSFGITGPGITALRFPNSTINKVRTVEVLNNGDIKAYGEIDPEFNGEKDIALIRLDETGTPLGDNGMQNVSSFSSGDAFMISSRTSGNFTFTSRFTNRINGDNTGFISVSSNDSTVSNLIFDGLQYLSVGIPGKDVFIQAAKMLSNNKFAVFGYARTGFEVDALLYILDENGVPDSTFSETGYVLIDNFSSKITDVFFEDDAYYFLTHFELGGASVLGKVSTTGEQLNPFNGNNYLILEDFKFARRAHILPDESVIFTGNVDENFGLCNFNPCQPIVISTENIITKNVILYPNPSNHFIQTPFELNSNYLIYNGAGQIIKRGLISMDRQVDISLLQNGIYFIQSDLKVGKFVKN